MPTAFFVIPPRKKNFFLSPQSSGSRTGGYLLSCPTLCKHWRVDFLSQPPFFSNFSIPAALAAHRYSWTSMISCLLEYWRYDLKRLPRKLKVKINLANNFRLMEVGLRGSSILKLTFKVCDRIHQSAKFFYYDYCFWLSGNSEI